MGIVPHLSWDLMSNTDDDESPILCSISNVIQLQKPLKALKTDLQQLSRSPGKRPIFLSVYDCLTPIKHGTNKKAGIAYRHTGGYGHMNGINYLDLVSCVKPHVFQSLCDSDTPADASNKRISFSVTRSREYLDELRLRQEKGLTDVSQPVFGSLEGGFDMKARLKSATDLNDRNVNGFVIEGFHDYDPDNSQILCPEAYHLLHQAVNSLQTEKPKAIFGCFKPETMLQLMRQGVDLFDSSYATMLTEKGFALLINYVSTDGPAGDSDFNVKSEIMDLNDAVYKNDMKTIGDDCKCYTCRQEFTKAYINHLLVTKEMLSRVLLNLHNLFALYAFFRKVRNHYHLSPVGQEN